MLIMASIRNTTEGDEPAIREVAEYIRHMLDEIDYILSVASNKLPDLRVKLNDPLARVQ